MQHAQFVEAWREGRVMVAVDPQAAPSFLAARLLLPFVAIAVIGAGIGLVLWGHIWTGLAVGALGIVVPRLIKRGAVRFILANLATDEALYADALRSGVLQIQPANVETAPN